RREALARPQAHPGVPAALLRHVETVVHEGQDVVPAVGVGPVHQERIEREPDRAREAYADLRRDRELVALHARAQALGEERRLPARTAPPRPSACLATIRNSSPPQRITVSASRVKLRRSWAVSVRTTSPAWWPRRSLTSLKWSRSRRRKTRSTFGAGRSAAM